MSKTWSEWSEEFIEAITRAEAKQAADQIIGILTRHGMSAAFAKLIDRLGIDESNFDTYDDIVDAIVDMARDGTSNQSGAWATRSAKAFAFTRLYRNIGLDPDAFESYESMADYIADRFRRDDDTNDAALEALRELAVEATANDEAGTRSVAAMAELVRGAIERSHTYVASNAMLETLRESVSDWIETVRDRNGE